MSDAKVVKQDIPQAATASRSKLVKATPFLPKSLSFAAPSTGVALPAAISNPARFYTGMEDYSLQCKLLKSIMSCCLFQYSVDGPGKTAAIQIPVTVSRSIVSNKIIGLVTTAMTNSQYSELETAFDELFLKDTIAILQNKRYYPLLEKGCWTSTELSAICYVFMIRGYFCNAFEDEGGVSSVL
jgi:hypothetical protein